MVLTITIMCIAFMVIIVIAYMVYNDYQVQQDIDKKLLVSKQKDIISEADDLLLNVTQIPYTQKIVSILQSRVMFALKQILIVTPNSFPIQQRIADLKNQITQSAANPIIEAQFSPPTDSELSMKMLRVLRRLRKILRIEFNRGRLSQADLLKEDKRLELMIFKIQFNNLLKNIEEAYRTNQLGTMKQLMIGGLNTLQKLNIEDGWLKAVQEKLSADLKAINEEAAQHNKQEMQEMASKEKDDDQDMIFGTKKNKW